MPSGYKNLKELVVDAVFTGIIITMILVLGVVGASIALAFIPY